MSDILHKIDEVHDEIDEDEISDSFAEDDSSDTDHDKVPLTTPALKRKFKYNKVGDAQHKHQRKESNRLSAQRSRQRQKILEVTLQEQMSKLKLDKTNLDTRFKNSVKEIFKLWPLPDQIPDEFSSLGLLLNLIDKNKGSSENSVSTSSQNTQIPQNPLRSLSMGNINVPAINTNQVNLQNRIPSQMVVLNSIINSQQPITGTMNSTSLAGSGIPQGSTQQFTGSNIYRNRYQQENPLFPIRSQSSVQPQSNLTAPVLFDATNPCRKIFIADPEFSNGNSSTFKTLW